MSQADHTVARIKERAHQASLQGQYGLLQEMIIDSDDTAMHNPVFIDECLRQLDIQEHSAAILCLLVNKIHAPNVSFEQTFGQLNQFITDCTDEVKGLPNLFARLCRHISEKLVDSTEYLKGVDLLSKAIPKVQQQPSQLTSIHCELCKLCLLAKCLKPALTFLDVDISDISKEGDSFDVKYYLMYFYYGGIIYSTLRNFDRAFFFFQTAISTGGTAISEILVESYKKFILVSLLVYGKVTRVPKNNQNYISRCVRPLAQPYNELATAYNTDSVEELKKVFAKHQGVFTNDTNVGLVKQVIASMVKVKIQKLTMTFMTLSLNDMAAKVGLPNEKEAERIILQMIEDEQIFATINQRDGMVRFLEKPEKYNSPQMYRLIEQELNKCIKLNEKLKELDEDILLNPKYQKMRAYE